MTTKDAIWEIALQLEVHAKMDGEDAQQTAADLVAWYNRAEPDKGDVRLLVELARKGQFRSWECLTCDERVYQGSPDKWGHFQGVQQVDYASYPGGNPEQCDYCRCHAPMGED